MKIVLFIAALATLAACSETTRTASHTSDWRTMHQRAPDTGQ